MRGHDNPAPAGRHHLIELPPALLRYVYGRPQPLHRDMRHLKQIDEVPRGIPEYPAHGPPNLLVGRAGP